MSIRDVDKLSISQTLKKRTVIQIPSFNFVVSLAGWSMSTFLPVFFVKERGLTIPEASFLMNVTSASGVLRMPLAGYLTDKFGFKIPSYLSMIILISISLFVPAFPVGVHTVIAFILWVLFSGMSFTAIMVLLTEVAPVRVLGTFFGILNFVGWIGRTIGPIALGRVIDLFGFTSFFYSVLFIHIISSIIIITAKKS